MKHEESKIQQVIISWCELNKQKYKDIEFIHHSPNGGFRNIREASRFKKEGVRAGFPDLFLAVPQKGFNGLFVEVKTSKGKLSPNQKLWKEKSINNGYAFYIVRSLEDFINVIKDYYYVKSI